MLSPEKLKYLRQLHNLSQKEIGDELGISKNYICMIENRKHTFSKEQHDRYVAAVYKVSAKKNKQKENVEEILQEVEKTVKENKEEKVNSKYK